MPVEIKVLGFAAVLQFVQFVLMAVPVNVQLGPAYTGGSRDEEKRATGVAGRLKRAMENHFEGLILFTIAVIVVVRPQRPVPGSISLRASFIFPRMHPEFFWCAH